MELLAIRTAAQQLGVGYSTQAVGLPRGVLCADRRRITGYRTGSSGCGGQTRRSQAASDRAPAASGRRR